MIGVLDWGIGGLGFYKLLAERNPRLPLVYLSDTGATPYGKLPAAALRRRVLAAATLLRAHGVTRLVVACNAASTALPALGVVGVGHFGRAAASDRCDRARPRNGPPIW